MEGETGLTPGAPDITGTLPPQRREKVARELGGDLPCVRCRYNLRGLSVRAVCPECGTPVRVTLLAVVDPRAGELQIIRWRWPVALGLLVWSLSAVVAAAANWTLRITDLTNRFAGTSLDTSWAAGIVVAGCFVSGLGALAMLRPHAGIPLRARLEAGLAIAAYIPLTLILAWIHLVHDPGRPEPYFGGYPGSAARELARLASGFLIIVILVGLRSNWQLMVKRSVLMRTGRRERQPMPTLAGVVAAGAVGDLVRLLSRDALDAPQSVIFTIGTCLIGVSSVLLVVGLVHLLWDTWRLKGVILDPPLSMKQVMSGDPRPA